MATCRYHLQLHKFCGTEKDGDETLYLQLIRWRSRSINIFLFLTPVLNCQEIKKLCQALQKSSWNESYSDSSFTKQSSSKMALQRWIKMESRWNVIIITVVAYSVISEYAYFTVLRVEWDAFLSTFPQETNPNYVKHAKLLSCLTTTSWDCQWRWASVAGRPWDTRCTGTGSCWRPLAAVLGQGSANHCRLPSQTTSAWSRGRCACVAPSTRRSGTTCRTRHMTGPGPPHGSSWPASVDAGRALTSHDPRQSLSRCPAAVHGHLHTTHRQLYNSFTIYARQFYTAFLKICRPYKHLISGGNIRKPLSYIFYAGVSLAVATTLALTMRLG